MGNFPKQFEDSQLDGIGGEPLEGSGFENEISDPSFEMPDRNPTNQKRQRSARKEERGDAE